MNLLIAIWRAIILLPIWKKMSQPFNPPLWDHVGPIKFRIHMWEMSFKINDEPWFYIPLGSLECSKALLAVCKQGGKIRHAKVRNASASSPREREKV